MVAKITGAEGVRSDETARRFDDEVSFYPTLAAGKIKRGMVLIFRYKPLRCPGMPEVQ
jgi:dihydroxy-acid dehydratase